MDAADVSSIRLLGESWLLVSDPEAAARLATCGDYEIASGLLNEQMFSTLRSKCPVGSLQVFKDEGRRSEGVVWMRSVCDRPPAVVSLAIRSPPAIELGYTRMIERTLSGYQLAFVRMALHKKVEIRKLEAARSAAFATRSIGTFPASTGVFHAGATSLLGTMIRRDAGRMSTVQVHGLDSPQGPYGALSYSRAIAIANDASCLVYFSGLMCMEPSRSDGATSIEKELDDVLRKFDATLSSICVDGRRFNGDLKSSAFCCSAFVAHEELVEATRRIVVDACPNAQCAVFVAGLARSSHVEVEMQAVLDGAPIG